jgi:crossover junction endodeoxyribonuclease RuvC
MRILGVDPGLECTGIGVIDTAGERCLHVFHGVVRTRSTMPIAERLTLIRDGVLELATTWNAESGSIEASFVGNNARSALALGQARAAAILGMAACGLEVAEYTPTIVKQTVSGYGHGGKAQVAEMVRLQLQLSAVPTPADASDALAIAITHWAHARHSFLR